MVDREQDTWFDTYPGRGAIVSFVLCLIRTLFFHGFFRFLGNLAPDLTLDAPASTLSVAAAVNRFDRLRLCSGDLAQAGQGARCARKERHVDACLRANTKIAWLRDDA
jgi:hypothetical protein